MRIFSIAHLLTSLSTKNEAKEIIRSMRYREDGSGYFWIDDTDYNLVMHPILTDQEGSNRLELKDQNGVFIIQEIMKMLTERPVSIMMKLTLTTVHMDMLIHQSLNLRCILPEISIR